MGEIEVKKESYLKKGLKIFNKIPKIGRMIILIIVIGVFSYIGLTMFPNFSTHSKATKFGLENMGELITQSAHVTVVQDSSEDKEFFNLFKIPFTKSRMIFSYDFTVDASVNFEQISYTIDDKNKEIKVKLPHAKHYKTTLILDSQEVYLDEGSIFSRIDLKEQNKAMLEMENKATDTAIANDLLKAADKNAKTILTSMLKSDLARKDYEVKYKYID